MTIKYSLGLSQGVVSELAGFQDPAEAFDALVAVTKAAERSGYHCVYVADHLVTIPPTQNMVFECWTTTAALLRETERIRIGQLVTSNDYHNPALQAKMASSADALGKGRFTFGIGAGWYEADYYSYGFDFQDGATRLRKLDEAAQIITSMWTRDETTFEGKHYRVDKAVNQPRGVQSPHVPMLIGGGGEKVTLKLVAKYADLCNLIGDPATVAHKLGVLRKHCEDVGRDYDTIQRTVLMLASLGDTDDQARSRVPAWAPGIFPGDIADYGLVGTVDTIRERIAAYEAVGAQEFVIYFPDGTDPAEIERFAEAFIA